MTGPETVAALSALAEEHLAFRRLGFEMDKAGIPGLPVRCTCRPGESGWPGAHHRLGVLRHPARPYFMRAERDNPDVVKRPPEGRRRGRLSSSACVGRPEKRMPLTESRAVAG